MSWPGLQALLSGQGQGGVAQGQKVYIDIMTAGPLDITVSFLPAPWDPQSGQFLPGRANLCGVPRQLCVLLVRTDSGEPCFPNQAIAGCNVALAMLDPFG